MRLPAILLLALALSGCLGADPADDAPRSQPLSDPFTEEARFSTYGCEGYELADEWVGPIGPNGPTAPEGWQDPMGQDRFTVGFQVMRCDRLAWGPLDRGPVWIGFESHTSFNAPQSCTDDLPEPLHRVYPHGFYTDDPDVAEYARSHGLTTHVATFSEGEPGTAQAALRIEPEGGDSSIITVVDTHAVEGPFASESVAYLWADGDRVHRLAVFTEGETTLGDVSSVEWGAPMILSDRPGPMPTRVSVVSGVAWDGGMASFADLDCTERM